METNYLGIDYGLGKSNIDKNRIRFGVIQHSEVGQIWYEESEAIYFYFCHKCDTELGNEYPENCSECGYEFSDYEFAMQDPDYFIYKKGGYKIFESYDDPDLFIEKSPYFTYAQFCSPCAPGAVYLMNYIKPIIDCPAPVDKCGQPLENNKGYCLGHDWFESGKAPYPVYSVETNKLII